MARFFRTIRSYLLNRRETRKYLLYAFGEIILVVIGILLALQINNWNQERIIGEDIRGFLQSLRSDLLKDTEQLKLVQAEQGDRWKLINEILNQSDAGRKVKFIDSSNSPRLNIGGNPTFFPIVGAYRSASNSNVIEQLKNEKLKNAIYNLYEHHYSRLSYNGQILDGRVEKFDWESLKFIDFNEARHFVKREALLDKSFLAHLTYMNRFAKVYLDRCKEVEMTIEELIKQIDGELRN